jgi:hypothetical protein
MSSAPVPLNVIEVARPCTADWESMKAEGPRRFCTHCNEYVHDLSALTRQEAENLLCASAGRLCARFARDEQGEVVTLDYQNKRRPRGWRFWTGIGLIGALGAGAVQAIVLKHFAPTPPVPVLRMTMGDIAPPPMMMGKIARPSCTTQPASNSGDGK